ncbi:homeobox transcription factor AhpA [Histoplasma ohiense]|nr:homeobox transcription factor AhpA [Histoplasma ohiense (nom. inval.)]
MFRKAKTVEESNNMVVSYSNEFRTGGQTQTLPPFRDLLPQYLHEEIDSTPYLSPTTPHQQGSSSHVSSPVHPRSILGANLSRSQPVTKFDSYEEYPSRTERFPKYQPQGGVAPLKRHASDTNSPSSTIPSSRVNSAAALPPINDIHSFPANRSLYTRGAQPNNFSEYHYSPTRESPSFSSRPPDSHFTGCQPLHVIPANSLLPSEPMKLNHQYESPRYGSYPQSFRPELDYSPISPGGFHDQSFVTQTEPIDSKNKKRRGNLPKSVTDVLRAWFHEHLDHPYPSEEDKQMFISRTGLTISQISNWFINARRRQLPALRNQARASESGRSGLRQSPLSDNEPTSSPSSV